VFTLPILALTMIDPGVHFAVIPAFTMAGTRDHDARNQRPGSLGMSDQDRPEAAIRMGRNTQMDELVARLPIASDSRIAWR